MNTTALAPLETFYEVERGHALPLPPDLATLYGRLDFPLHPGRPYVIGNFVTTLDGVVTLNVPGQAGGGPISGFNQHDHLVMWLMPSLWVPEPRGPSRITVGQPSTSLRHFPKRTIACG
jgi:hypothetical protein